MYDYSLYWVCYDDEPQPDMMWCMHLTSFTCNFDRKHYMHMHIVHCTYISVRFQHANVYVCICIVNISFYMDILAVGPLCKCSAFTDQT